MFEKLKAEKFAKVGIGPFTSEYLRHLLIYKCQSCGQAIPENSVFGNSLIISHGEISLLCSQCRTGTRFGLKHNHPFNALPQNPKHWTVSPFQVVFEIREITNGKINLSYYDIALCLRNSYGYLQKHNREAYAGFSEEHALLAKDRFGKAVPGSCGECGGLWANEYEVRMKMDVAKERNFNGKSCPYCSFPVAKGWFIRESFESEQDKILASNARTPKGTLLPGNVIHHSN